VLGPVESLVEVAAFLLVLTGFGWYPGAHLSNSALAAASGAAFLAIVAGQAATALVCRSSTRFVFSMPLRDNPRIALAILGTWVMAAVLLGVPWFARHLGQAVPPPIGLFVALLAFPAVLVADTVMKYARRSTSGASPTLARFVP
jgi:magnesium-transporting ATPase (P-type)